MNMAHNSDNRHSWNSDKNSNAYFEMRPETVVVSASINGASEQKRWGIVRHS